MFLFEKNNLKYLLCTSGVNASIVLQEGKNTKGLRSFRFAQTDLKLWPVQTKKLAGPISDTACTNLHKLIVWIVVQHACDFDRCNMSEAKIFLTEFTDLYTGYPT